MAERKKEIRASALRKRDALSSLERSEKSARIIGKLLHHPLYEKAETVYCYVSCRSEVDTLPILAFSMAIGKRVAVPKVIGTEMRFFYIQSLEELKTGYRDIPEPVTQEEAHEEDALMLLPMTAFDKRLNRLGYGGGYYDRYLEEHWTHPKIGLAFACQRVEEIPAEWHDIRPDLVLTEEE